MGAANVLDILFDGANFKATGVIVIYEQQPSYHRPRLLQPLAERYHRVATRHSLVHNRGGKGHDVDKPKILIEYD